MKSRILCSLFSAVLLCSSFLTQCEVKAQTLRGDISLSDPFVMADTKTQKYYMMGTGGQMWTSSDLEIWTGPQTVIQTDGSAWMGASPQVWASEIYALDGKYYNLSTFTNDAITIDESGHSRRAVHILSSNLLTAPTNSFRMATLLTCLPRNRRWTGHSSQTPTARSPSASKRHHPLLHGPFSTTSSYISLVIRTLKRASKARKTRRVLPMLSTTLLVASSHAATSIVSPQESISSSKEEKCSTGNDHLFI